MHYLYLSGMTLFPFEKVELFHQQGEVFLNHIGLLNKRFLQKLFKSDGLSLGRVDLDLVCVYLSKRYICT